MLLNNSNEKALNDKTELDKDALKLHGALSKLVRVYQFRDRNRICYCDVSVTQCYAISALITNKAMTLNKLAAKRYLYKGTASRVINSLEQIGYVTRLVDPQDGRARMLELITQGKMLHSRIEFDLVNEMKQLLADFDPDVSQATNRLFSRLINAVKIRFSEKTKEHAVERKD